MTERERQPTMNFRSQSHHQPPVQNLGTWYGSRWNHGCTSDMWPDMALFANWHVVALKMLFGVHLLNLTIKHHKPHVCMPRDPTYRAWAADWNTVQVRGLITRVLAVLARVGPVFRACVLCVLGVHLLLSVEIDPFNLCWKWHSLLTLGDFLNMSDTWSPMGVSPSLASFCMVERKGMWLIFVHSNGNNRLLGLEHTKTSCFELRDRVRWMTSLSSSTSLR